MNKIGLSLKQYIASLLMVAACLLAYFLQQQITTRVDAANINLDGLIPNELPGWREDKYIVPVQVSEGLKETLAKTYDQVITKTYYNSQGYRVMLSIAYGKSQTKALQVHKPETCYSAQGFMITDVNNLTLNLFSRTIKTRRVIASQGNRIEPITYWIRYADKTTYGGIEQTINRVTYGLKGTLPDGLLFRVSSIDNDKSHAYKEQLAFINDLMGHLNEDEKSFLMGKS